MQRRQAVGGDYEAPLSEKVNPEHECGNPSIPLQPSNVLDLSHICQAAPPRKLRDSYVDKKIH